ncbi:hypothetical protein [Candidatus Sororendozoicomonas aggregata]|uniref:FimV/HubP-related protein n=1 Tax=Candidatus Sororendozoicomonas aggregata TaxID=3073239 RepID=UPI002ED47D44
MARFFSDENSLADTEKAGNRHFLSSQDTVMLMLNKTVARVTLVYTLSGYVYAESEFGALTLHSLMNESLDATIILRHDASIQGHPIKLQLGSLVDFYRNKIEPSSLSSSLRFTIIEQDEKEAKVRVTSSLPVNAGDFGFVVRSYIGDKKTYGAYKYIKPAASDAGNKKTEVCNALTWSGIGSCQFLTDQVKKQPEKSLPPVKEAIKNSGTFASKKAVNTGAHGQSNAVNKRHLSQKNKLDQEEPAKSVSPQTKKKTKKFIEKNKSKDVGVMKKTDITSPSSPKNNALQASEDKAVSKALEANWELLKPKIKQR